MQVRLTGAAGFLGRPLLAALAAHGEAHAVKGDVTQPDTFQGLPATDLAYHLAAQSSVAQSQREPAGTWAVNAGGTLQLLEWARRDGVGRVVVVSSAHVYGRPERSPVGEGHPLRPVSPYGASKLAAEALALSYAHSYGLDVRVVRPFNVYGPGQAPGFLVPDILGPLRRGQAPVLGNPDPVRDYTFLDDAVRFLALAGTLPGLGGMALNLGSGKGHSVAEVAAAAVRAAGLAVRPVFDPARFRPNEVAAMVADVGLARRRLGWQPTVSLEEGLRRTWGADVGAATVAAGPAGQP